MSRDFSNESRSRFPHGQRIRLAGVAGDQRVDEQKDGRPGAEQQAGEQASGVERAKRVVLSVEPERAGVKVDYPSRIFSAKSFVLLVVLYHRPWDTIYFPVRFLDSFAPVRVHPIALVSLIPESDFIQN